MRIVSLHETPLAGSPFYATITAREAGYDAHSIQPASRTGYGDGRTFPFDKLVPQLLPEFYPKELSEPDLLLIHVSGGGGKRLADLFLPVVKPYLSCVVYHSFNCTLAQTAQTSIDKIAAVAQGQLAHYRKEDPTVVPFPNFVPLTGSFTPKDVLPDGTSRFDNGNLTICYSPSIVQDSPGAPYDKGYSRTIATVKEAIRRLGHVGIKVKFDLITNTDHASCLERKRRSVVCIDEIVTGNYHRSSLEAAALGVVPVNACAKDAITAFFEATASQSRFVAPFWVTEKDNFEQLFGWLLHFFQLETSEQIHRCYASRATMQNHWSPKKLWDTFIDRIFTK